MNRKQSFSPPRYRIWMGFVLVGLYAALLVAAYTAHAGDDRSPLQMVIKLELQREISNTERLEWITVHTAHYAGGIGALQSFIKPDDRHRLRITAMKPYDVRGTFQVRMPRRVDGVVAQEGQAHVSLIMGPQNACDMEEPRCWPITLDDIGIIELRMDLERAEETAFGAVMFRPYNLDQYAVRLKLRYRDKGVPCGATVKKGWWIFAKSMRASADPLETISLCVREPDGDYHCEDNGDTELKKKINQAGRYQFMSWSKSVRPSQCEVIAQ